MHGPHKILFNPFLLRQFLVTSKIRLGFHFWSFLYLLFTPDKRDILILTRTIWGNIMTRVTRRISAIHIYRQRYRIIYIHIYVERERMHRIPFSMAGECSDDGWLLSKTSLLVQDSNPHLFFKFSLPLSLNFCFMQKALSLSLSPLHYKHCLTPHESLWVNTYSSSSNSIKNISVPRTQYIKFQFQINYLSYVRAWFVYQTN